MKKIMKFILATAFLISPYSLRAASDAGFTEEYNSFFNFRSIDPITWQGPIEISHGGVEATIGVMFKNVPLSDGSTIRLVLSSADARLNYDTGDVPVATNVFAFTINWPADASTQAMLTYTYQPKSTPQPEMTITVFASELIPFKR